MNKRPAMWIGLVLCLLASLPTQRILELTVCADGRIEPLPIGAAILGMRVYIGLIGGLLLFSLRSRRVANRIILVMLAVGAAIIFGELVLHLVYRPSVLESGWLTTAARLEQNELGYRGRSIEYTDGDYVVVLLGDSQVGGRACAYGWMPERRLEHHLRRTTGRDSIRVFSVGAGGYGQDQQLLAMKRYYRRFRADMVVLWQTPKNDIWNNMFPTHWSSRGTPKPTYRLEKGVLIGPHEMPGTRLRHRSMFRMIDLVRNRMVRLGRRDQEWERYLPPAYEPMNEYEGEVNMSWQVRWDGNVGFMRLEHLDSEKSHLAIYLTPPSPRMQYGMKLTRALITDINQLVTSENGKLILFLVDQPSGVSAQEEVYVLNGKYYKVSDAQRQACFNHINRGFTVVATPVHVVDHTVGPLDSHLNQHAVDDVMMGLANHLTDLYGAALAGRR